MFLKNIFEALARTGEGKAAVVGWGRGMGHKGHMYLASSVITHADQLGADPYFVVSRTVGKDDPITPEEKLAIYKKVFPEQGHIFQTATDEIPDLTRVLSDLNRQGYTSATIVLGADQVKAFQYLKNYNGKPDKAGNVPYEFDTLDVISRQETSDPSAGEEGPRATPMRAVLMDPTKSEEEQFQVWRDAMNPQISDDEVRDLMAKAKERMTAMSAPKPKKAKAVAEGNYTTEKQILTRIRQIMYDRKLSGTESNTGELNRLKQQLKDIRSQQGVAENYHSDLMKQTYAKFFKPAPPRTVSAVKKFLSGVIISLGTAQDNDYDEKNPEEISWEQDLSDVREAYSKLRSNTSPNWFDLADAVLSYDTEFRESMLEWAEEELGNKLVDFLWDEVWEAKNQISRSDGSYNVALGHQSVSGQKSDRDSYKPWDPEKDPPNPFADLQWKVMINGEQKVKFGGVGNNKEAAMKVALGWARNHGYEREVQAGKIEVVQAQQDVAEEWSQKYKSSINCSHPKGFSQKAHCAGKKKHNEDVEMEAVCPDCGMCEAHGNNKIYDKCWTGFRKVPGKKRGEDDSCKKIGEVDDPWGPQGRFAGDTHVDVGGEVAGPKLQVGDLVQVNAGNIKGVGEIWEIKGDQAEVWIDSYARSFNIDLTDLTPYVRSGNVEQTLEEGTSIESTLRAIINDIGEPITSVYDAMKFQAKKYVDNHGELDRGFRMVAAGIGGRWVQNMYVGRLQNELYDLCRYNTRRTVELQEFLRGVEIDGELEMKRSFGNIANNLPRILAKLGQHLDAPQLTKNANRWMQNKAAYEEYIVNLEAEDDYEEPASVKAPKSNVIGQQNAQVDQIVNSVLSKLPKRIQGDIRNAIARAPNKLQALQAELQKRGQQGMAEAKRKKKSSRSLRGYFFPGYGYYGGDESGDSSGGEGASEGSEKTECPPATQDIALNLKNRQKAIDEYGYGPLNPDMPNNTFWMKKVDEWNLDSVDEAKQSLCGNCAAFDQREDTLNCIAQGIDSDNPTDAEGTIDAGDLGYCKFLKFKCASRRTCDAWVTGGPLVNEVTFKKSPYGKTAASQQRAKELLNPPKPPEPKKDEKDTTEHIVKVKGGYELRSKHGNKNLGKYPTRAGAEKRERQVQYFKHAGESTAVEPDPTGYQKDLLTSPENTLVIDTPGDLDWYKLGQHYPTLGTDDPHEYGQGDSDMVIIPYSKRELALLKQKLDRLEMRYKEIGGGNEQPEIHDKVEEKIKGVDGKACWPGKRYAGRVQKADGTYKDKCIPVSEDIQNVMDVLINKIVVNEAIQNNKR
jgi:hypothetical protein